MHLLLQLEDVFIVMCSNTYFLKRGKCLSASRTAHTLQCRVWHAGVSPLPDLEFTHGEKAVRTVLSGEKEADEAVKTKLISFTQQVPCC